MKKYVPHPSCSFDNGCVPTALHTTRACSTLIIGGFTRLIKDSWGYDPNFDNPEWVISALIEGVNYFNKQVKELIEKEMSGYYFHQYAHMFGSTIDSMTSVEAALEELGFNQNQAVFNTKNSTNCTVWITEIPTLIKKFADYGLNYDKKWILGLEGTSHHRVPSYLKGV